MVDNKIGYNSVLVIQDTYQPIKVYKQRWIVLILYILYNAANTFQWMEYSIITNIITRYYNVSSLAVDWTSIIYMIIYPIIVVPASFFIEVKGLRFAGLIGCLGTALAAAIKICSVDQSMFYVVLIGQAIGSTAQVFVLCLPTKIAATWFKSTEASTVCALAVFGTQLGFGAGFLIPTVFVQNHESAADVGHDLNILCWGLTVFMIPVSLGVLFSFPTRPKLPPSVEQYRDWQPQKHNFKKFLLSLKELCCMKSFALQLFASGINVGILSSLSTLLNQLILQYFKNAEEDAGRIGMLMVIFGVFASIFFGFFLDRTHKYKETIIFIYIMCCFGMVSFMIVLELEIMWLTYLTAILAGAFLNSYLPVAFEFSAELTYPAAESTTAGLLMGMTQLMGVIFTLLFGKINMFYGAFWTLASKIFFLIIGLFFTLLIPNDLKRQNALRNNANK